MVLTRQEEFEAKLQRGWRRGRSGSPNACIRFLTDALQHLPLLCSSVTPKQYRKNRLTARKLRQEMPEQPLYHFS